MKEHSKLKHLLEAAWSMRREGRYDDARNLVEKAQKQCKLDDYNSLGRIFHIYMQFESDHENYTNAEKFCKKSVGFYKKANNPDKIAHSTRHLADLQYQLGKYGASEINYRLAIGIYMNTTSTLPGNMANALRAFAILLERQGKVQEAIETWEETKDIYSSIGLQQGVDEAQERLTMLKNKF